MTPTEHFALLDEVRALEDELARTLRINHRLRAELAATGRAAQALATYGPTEPRP